MEGRLLNLLDRLRQPEETVPCKPEVKVLSWPSDGTRVAFDPNALTAVALPKGNGAVTTEALVDAFAGLLGVGLAPAFKCYPQTPLRHLVLSVTHRCNLACSYCLARGRAQEADMTRETVDQSLGTLPEDQPVALSFFGGEPLLAWDICAYAGERAQILARRRKVPCKLHLTTNGTLLNDIKAAVIKRQGWSVLLSLDGPQDLHDAARGPSWHRAMAGLDCLNRAGVRPMLRATFSALPAALVERMVWAAGLADANKISGISLEPAILTEGCAATPTAEVDLAQLEAEWHAVAQWCLARIQGGKPAMPYFFAKMLRRLLCCEYSGSECGAGLGYQCVGPDGTRFACHREGPTAIGTVGALDETARAPWKENHIAAHTEDCPTCWARYLCGGGCRHNRLLLGGSLHAPIPGVCNAIRLMISEVLWIAAHLTPEQARKVVTG